MVLVQRSLCSQAGITDQSPHCCLPAACRGDIERLDDVRRVGGDSEDDDLFLNRNCDDLLGKMRCMVVVNEEVPLVGVPCLDALLSHNVGPLLELPGETGPRLKCSRCGMQRVDLNVLPIDRLRTQHLRPLCKFGYQGRGLLESSPLGEVVQLHDAAVGAEPGS